MNFPMNFICAGNEYATIEKPVAAPLLRKTFELAKNPVSAELLITGQGFYEVHINGKDITKGFLAPYRSNPDQIVYYDKYDITNLLTVGKNVIGCILGNGMQNAIGAYTWKFDTAPWRSAPMVSFSVVVTYKNGETETIISDTDTLVTDSPIIFDDLHMGEYYDARKEIEGWDLPQYDDSAWEKAKTATAPKGTPALCKADPIVVRNEVTPVSITPYNDGFVYDFGINTTGLCRLKIKGQSGQKVLLKHFESIIDGTPYFEGVQMYIKRGQEDEYYCSGKGVEIHTPRFTYHGFRYVFVSGITKNQATPDLLTMLEINSDVKVIGSFSCDNQTVNKIQEATLRSDISNFHYFPTDCPHREKNGWTADAALSAEQFLFNLTPEKSYKEWLRSIYKAMDSRGAIPGIIPTAGWGFEWGNGPAWDYVLVALPFFTYLYRGDLEILEESAQPLMRYIKYLDSRLDEKGLIAIGLGDWCQTGRPSGEPTTPLIVTDSIITADIARKAEFIYDKLNMPAKKKYAGEFADKITSAVRKHLINHETVTVKEDTQTGQAMAIFYGMFTKEEIPNAVEHLVELIHKADDHMDVGVLGNRVIFRVLADNGYADLAFKMITRPDWPSFGYLIEQGSTTLWETFTLKEDGTYALSRNHHFWGDVSAWFYTYLGGIRINPTGKDFKNVNIKPCFVSALNEVTASHLTESGEIFVQWKRTGAEIQLDIKVPKTVYGEIVLPEGYEFKGGDKKLPLESGTYIAF